MRRALVVALALAAGCGAEPRTEIVLIVRSNFDAGALQSARIVVANPANPSAGPLYQSACFCIGDAPCTPLPLTLGLLANDSSTRPFEVSVSAFADRACGGFAVENSATVSFTAHQTLALELSLLAECAGVQCAPGMTCVDASQACVGDGRPSLPPYTPGLVEMGLPPPPDLGSTETGDLASSDMAGMTSTDMAPQLPGTRTHPAMAYDANRGRVVMFGGYGATAPFGDTWEWDGSAWHLILTSGGPTARAGDAMVYDSARHRVVLFGGNDGNDSNETWAWNGTSWSVLSSTGPAPRSYHAMAYDIMRDRIVLFGGNGSPPTSDTWEFDGTTWSAKANGSPAGRLDHAMAYDATRHVTVMFGGNNGSSVPYSDAYEWNGTAWSTAAGATPPARYQHAMAYDSRRQVVLAFDGFDGNSYLPAALWAYDGTGWTTLTTGGPGGRTTFGFAFDSGHNQAVFYAGYFAGDQKMDTWTWDSALNLWALH